MFVFVLPTSDLPREGIKYVVLYVLELILFASRSSSIYISARTSIVGGNNLLSCSDTQLRNAKHPL